MPSPVLPRVQYPFAGQSVRRQHRREPICLGPDLPLTPEITLSLVAVLEAELTLGAFSGRSALNLNGSNGKDILLKGVAFLLQIAKGGTDEDTKCPTCLSHGCTYLRASW